MKIRAISVAIATLLGAPINVFAEQHHVTQSQQVMQFDIAAGQLKNALIAFASSTKTQVFVKDEILKQKRNIQLRGQYSPQHALEKLLSGTGLQSEWKGSKGVIIKAEKTDAITQLQPTLPETPVNSNDPLQPLEVIQVNGSRMQQGLVSIARQTSYLNQEDVEQALLSSENLAQMVAKLIPGMAPSGQTMTNFGLTLRGRNMLVLVDGVPMNTNRNVSRDLFNLDPSIIQSIEVVRGGNAIYGAGASGGVMYITTKTAQQSQTQTRMGIATSLTQLSADATAYNLGQTIAGEHADLAYSLALDVTDNAGFYDANGQRLAPEPSQGDLFDTRTKNLQAKLDYTLNSTSRLSSSVVWFDAEQNTQYASDPSVTEAPLGSVAARSRKGLELEQQNQASNMMLNLHYYNSDAFGQRFSGQIYYRDYETRFYPFDGRPYSTWAHLGQSYLASSTLGFRSSFTYQVNQHRLIYGADGHFEQTESPVTVYDPKTYDESLGLHFKKLEDKVFMPKTDTNSLAGFIQYQYNSQDGLQFDAGIRHEAIDVSFDDFTTLGQQNQVKGGSKSYSDTVFNLSINYQLSDQITTYAAFNQGFELPDIGLLLRYAKPEFDIASSELKPVTADNFELGFNYSSDVFTLNSALFHSTSDYGRVKTQGFGFNLRRDQEKISGLEVEGSFVLSDDLTLALLVSKIKGEEKPESAQTWREMNGFRIPPLKASLNLDYVWQHWRFGGQVNYVASEDYRLDDKSSFGRHQVDSYTTVDLCAQLDLDEHQFSFGVENATNRDYYPLYSQLLRSNSNTSHIPARGALLRAHYSYQW